MAIEIINMPRLSDTMEEGTVVKWHKKIGDKIKEGEILAEIETDKATMEFESFFEGTLLYIGLQEGDIAPVDSLLAIVGEKGDDISSYINGNNNTEKNIKVEENTVKNEEKSSDINIDDLNVEIVTMPRLSDTMEEGTVVKWHKKIGNEVKEGEILAEIQTDKATMDFEAFQSGNLLHIGINEGETAKVESLLAILGEKGTDITPVLNKFDSSNNTEIKNEEVKEEKIISNEKPKTSKKTFISETGIKASPLARRIAKDRNIDITKVKGTGEDGRIIRSDVEFYNENITTNNLKSSNRNEENSYEEINSSMRKTIAKRLSQSKFTAPHYYLNMEISMDNLISIRKEVNSKEEVRISFNDIIVKATAEAIRKNPKINTTWKDDKTIFNNNINIGVAVAIDDGLVVPVIKFTDTKGILEISSEVKNLAKKAKDKKLGVNEMTGSTFTISNLGMFGIESFTSIINQPDSCILSVGAIIEKPVVKNGQIVVGSTMKITLACDHRTVDGSIGSAFLSTLKDFLENPFKILL